MFFLVATEIVVTRSVKNIDVISYIDKCRFITFTKDNPLRCHAKNKGIKIEIVKKIGISSYICI